MAITKIDFPTASTPSYTPSISTDYNNQNEYIERNARGYNAVSLTNWDATSTAPEVAAGSVIEANGATWDITTDTSISTSGASSGISYIVFDDSVPEFKISNTAPTWSTSLNGWYNSTIRYTGHVVDWDGSSAYENKRYFLNNDSGYQLNLLGGGSASHVVNSVSETLFVNNVTASSTTISDPLPPGLLYYRSEVNGTGVSAAAVRVSDDNFSTFEVINIGGPTSRFGLSCSGMLLSDGKSYKVWTTLAAGDSYVKFYYVTVSA